MEITAKPLQLPSDMYAQKQAQDGLQPDTAQLAALPQLDALAQALAAPVTRDVAKGVKVWRRTDATSVPQGIYLYGEVGRGKSMLMQLLFDAVPMAQKRRVHFHPFMEELHKRLHEAAGEQEIDLVLQMASDISANARLLCFDEFFVTNIGDAMLLGRLLEALFHCGVTLCVTSNWAPDNLYQDGHNRSHFMPFMKIIKKHVEVIQVAEGQDWRRHGEAAEKAETPAQAFMQLAGKPAQAGQVKLGREQLQAEGVANDVYWFSFHELCARFLSRTEYMQLAQVAKGVVISGLPKLDANKADAAMRFIVLVDLLYEMQIPLRVFSELPLEDVCRDGAAAFAFQRTLSRIHELEKRGC